jgi:hypothetical protein
MARLLKSFVTLAILATAGGAAAQRLRPVDPAALAQTALACRGIPDEMAGAERRIVELGWSRQASGQSGLMFERDGAVLVLTPPDAQGHPLMCAIMATVRRSAGAAEVSAAASAAFGRQPGPGDAGGFPAWELDGGQVAVVAADGEGGVLFSFWYPRNAPR